MALPLALLALIQLAASASGAAIASAPSCGTSSTTVAPAQSSALLQVAHQSTREVTGDAKLQAFGGTTRTARPPPHKQSASSSLISDMKAVVSDFDGSRDVDWIKQRMEVDIVGKGSPRSISESRPWLQWIVDNYDKLPSRVFFSHGEQVSWHCHHNVEKITALTKPTMLSECTWEGLQSDLWDGNLELPYLDGIHLALYNSTFQSWYQLKGFEHRKCCAENVATSDAIRRHDRKVYQELVALIDAHTGPRKYGPPFWGMVMEMTWQSLFTEAPARGSEDVVKALQEFRRSIANQSSIVLEISKQAGNGTVTGYHWNGMERRPSVGKSYCPKFFHTTRGKIPVVKRQGY